eukprot:12902740-Prorocentrum_lima.AAC.1
MEAYVHKLEFGMRLGSLMEPRAILTVVRDTVETVASKEDLLNKILMDELSEPVLRNPRNREDVP